MCRRHGHHPFLSTRESLQTQNWRGCSEPSLRGAKRSAHLPPRPPVCSEDGILSTRMSQDTVCVLQNAGPSRAPLEVT